MVGRRGRVVFSLLLFLCLAANASAQGETVHPELWWSFSPAAAVPLGLNSTYFSTGAVLDISAEYLHPALGGVSLLFGRPSATSPSLSAGWAASWRPRHLSGRSSIPLPLLRGLTGRVFADVGYSYVGFYEHVNSFYLWYGAVPFAEAGAGFSYAINPALALRFNASYVYFYELYGGLDLSLGVAFTGSKQPATAVPLPSRPKFLDFSRVKLGSVFPVLYAFTMSIPSAVRSSATRALSP